jgi:hypothetical protein
MPEDCAGGSGGAVGGAVGVSESGAKGGTAGGSKGGAAGGFINVVIGVSSSARPAPRPDACAGWSASARVRKRLKTESTSGSTLRCGALIASMEVQKKAMTTSWAGFGAA